MREYRRVLNQFVGFPCEGLVFIRFSRLLFLSYTLSLSLYSNVLIFPHLYFYPSFITELSIERDSAFSSLVAFR